MKVQTRRTSRNHVFQRKALALAIGGSVALAFAGGAFAQATTGTIYGRVPVAAGETVQITGGAGYNRTISVGPSGTYSITLPVGTYTVSLLQNGQVLQSKTGVSPVAAGAVAVDFTSSAAATQTLSTVNVTANAIPPIDVTTTNQVTTITAEQLRQLPLQHTAENIALLAPGTTPGGAALGSANPTALGTPLLVFGGASVAENAYYFDGMNTTDQITGQGGVSLPYGAIEQQQTYTTGYGAKYGRSVGGVINQIGKSGSNEWHFGFQASWAPATLQANPVNAYWNNPRYTGALALNPSEAYGQLYQYRKGSSGTLNAVETGLAVGQPGQETIYDAYVSGPIVKDKLFFFLGVEQDNAHSNSITPNTGNTYNIFFTTHAPKIYAKLNWNINESNFVTLTAAQNSFKSWGTAYDFDYSTFKTGAFNNLAQTEKNSFRTWVFNYTSYITDNLTLNAMFGKTHGEYYTQQPLFPGLTADLANISGSSSQNPAFLPPGSTGISNKQVNSNISRPNHRSSIMNYRLSLDWKLPWNLFGTHDVSVGIDNIT
ncbi:MAG TPA: carboxypeptidase-like regulatory domain-containing protein, partial [Rhodanobacteraceae bacterium]|nr:carboxypeptidase-like regulatory domain-containing protein [Rhodanobacteraceae bacterium]